MDIIGAGYMPIYHRGNITVYYNADRGILRFYDKQRIILELTDMAYSDIYNVMLGYAGERKIAEQRAYYRSTNHRYFTVNGKAPYHRHNKRRRYHRKKHSHNANNRHSGKI